MCPVIIVHGLRAFVAWFTGQKPPASPKQTQALDMKQVPVSYKLHVAPHVQGEGTSVIAPVARGQERQVSVHHHVHNITIKK